MANAFEQFDAASPKSAPADNPFAAFDKPSATPEHQPSDPAQSKDAPWPISNGANERNAQFGEMQGNKDAGFVSDTANLLWQGVTSAGQDVKELVNKIPTVGPAIVDGVDKLDKWLNDGKGSDQLMQDSLRNSAKNMSPETLQAMHKSFVTKDKQGDYTFGPAWSDWRSYYSGAVQSLPETVLTMGPAGKLAKGTYEAQLAKGASKAVAAEKAAKTAAIAGALVEGGLGGANASRNVRDTIMNMDPKKLAESDAMKELMKGGMSFERARQTLAEDSSSLAFVLAGTATGIFGGAGDRVLSHLVTNEVGRSLAGKMAKGAVAEGLLEEAPQGATQQVAQNYALQSADQSINLSDGAANQAVQGAVTGGIMGAGFGGVAHVAGANNPQPAHADGNAAPPVLTPEPAAANDQGRPDWANSQTDVFRNGQAPTDKPINQPDLPPIVTDQAPQQQPAENPFAAFDSKPAEKAAPKAETTAPKTAATGQETGQAAEDLTPFERNKLRDAGVTDKQLWSMSTDEARGLLADAAKKPKPAETASDQPKSSTLTEKGTGVYRVPVNQIKADPKQYQFRSKVGDKGTDKRLDSVKRWDDKRAGNVLLHQRKDGSLYVADGHHRVDLANRLGQTDINARVVSEANGVTVPAARLQAAMNNIADGKAEPTDVAKVFRDSAVPSSEVRDTFDLPASQVVRDGESLSKLSDNVFGMVSSGQLSEKDGAAIGAAFTDNAQQEAAAAAFQKVQPETEYQRHLLVSEVRSADFAKAQGDQGGLFGDDPQEVSLMQDRLKVLDALRQRLNSDKRLFKSLNDNADRAGEAGNTIATEANDGITKQSARSLDLISRVTTTPALNEMVNRAARRVYDGESKAVVVNDLKKELLSYEQGQQGANAASSGRSGKAQSSGANAESGAKPGARQRVSEQNAAGKDQGGQSGSAKKEQVTPDLQLQAQTEEQLAEQAKAKKDAEQAAADKRKQEEAKASADQQAKDFNLTGSDRTADVAAAAGQEDLLASAPAEQPGQPTPPIEDFGEKIEGARKDYASKLAAAKEKDIATVPLSESWPDPDYQKLLDAGADPEAVGFAHAARDEVPPKPRKGWKLKGWAKQVETLRSVSESIIDGSISMDDVRNLSEQKEFRTVSAYVMGRAELYAELGHSKSLKGLRFHKADFALWNGERDVTKWLIEKNQKATAFDNMPSQLVEADTKEEAIKKFRKVYESLDAKGKESKPVRFDIYSSRHDKADIFIGKKIGSDIVRIKEGFDSVKEARQYLSTKQDELEATLSKMKNIPDHRKETNSPRVGIDHRNGGDVTPEAFTEAFNFRGVQFGNFVEQGRRQQDLNEAYDGLMDLAGILNIPAKALSLNGELGLAFGARGKGGKGAAKAHYERGSIVINLTKKSGAGSLAHEWFHALDNYFGRARGASATERMATEGNPDMAVRPEVIDAFRNIRQTVNRIRMRERSQNLDKVRTKAYWSTDVEMAARAFESYVIEKLQDQQGANDYLANIVSEDYWKASEALGMQGSDSYPYPEAAEIPEVRAAYDNLFEVIETQETDDGNILMFSLERKSDPTAARYVRVNDNEKSPFSRSGYAMFREVGATSSTPDAQTTADALSNYGSQVWVTDGNAGNIVDEDRLSALIKDASGRNPDMLEQIAQDLNQETVTVDDVVEMLSPENILDSANGFDNESLMQILWDEVLELNDVDGIRTPDGLILYDTPDGESQIQSAGNLDDFFELPYRMESTSYRRTPEAQADTLTATEARTHANTLMRDWKGRPPVTVADSISELPRRLRDAIRKAQAEGDMRAVFFDDQVYILAPRIPSRAALEEVILHEVIGHYGLRKMLGKDMDRVLNQIWMAHGGQKRADFIIKRYFPGNSFDVNNKEHRHTVAEELIAHLAEQNRGQTLVQRAVAIIREGLRKLGFTLEFTVDDIVNLLRKARATVENGGFELDARTEGAAVAASKLSRAGRSGSDRATWPADFPKVPFAAPLGSADKHPRYAEAKSGGEDAAVELVNDLVSDSAVERVRAMIGDKKPTIVPVMAEEQTGHNAIPAAYAIKLAQDLELPLDGGIVQAVRARRTGTGADYRLANHSTFDGAVQAGRDYLIVDDTMTMGGTLAGLRGHIEANGGNVIGATTLTGFGNEGQLALGDKMRQDLWRKHGAPLDEYLKEEFGYGIDSLTQGEAGHFRKAVSIDAIRDRISAAKVARDDQQNVQKDGSSQSVIPPNFRFSRTGVPDLDPQPFGPPSDTLLRKAISKIADKFTVLKGVQQNIQERFGEIPEPANAYRAEELFHGKVENDIRLIQENMVEPLAKAMSDNDVSLKQLDEFLYALHAPERNRVIAERNPEIPEGGSGMTDAEAAEIINKVEKAGKLKQYQALAKRAHDMLAMRRKILKSAGLEDADTIGAWEASYKHYVPLKGWAADEQQPGMPRAGKGFAIAGKESQMAAGRKTKAASPVANTIADLSEAVLRRRKNEVGNAFMNLVEAYPNGSYWNVYTDENPEVDRKAVRVKDPETGKMKVEVREQTVPMAMMSDRYFTTKRDGKTYYIKIEDERLMNAMRNIGPDNSNLLVRSLAAVTRVMSSLNTSYNPEFVISNFSRDIQTALLNLTSEQSSEDGKARGKKIVAKVLKDTGIAIRAINASLKGKTLKGRAGQWQKEFDQFRRDGAKTGWFDMKDIDGQMKDLERMISVAGGGSVNSARRAFKAVTDWVENTNSAIENGVRLSAYVNAIEAGIPRSQAASLAKNMTVNFNRRGELGTTMNALYMFANASVQGTANFVRTLGRLNGVKGDPMWRRMHTAQKIAAGMAVGGFMLSALNRLVAGEDDDEVNWWDKVPDYVKERNIVLMKSLVGGEPGEYWTIPLPYGYNIFPVMGTQMEHVLFSENQTAGDAASNVILAALGSFSPIGFEQSEEAYGVLAKNIMPTILRPVASISLNENFMGGPIFKENFPFGTQKPDSALYFRSTPEAFKALAEGLNDATGGSEFRSGAVDLSPDVMQFLVGYYGGGAYNFFTSRTPNAITKWLSGVDLESREIPFWRKINGKVLPYEDQSKFYDRRNEIQQLVDERKALKGRERIRFMKDYRDKLRLAPIVDSTEKRLKILREQRDRIEMMDLSAAEEDKRLQRVEQQMKRAIDQFNKRYYEAED